MIIDPDYPSIILTFPYRGCTIEISQDDEQGKTIYTAWVNYPQGCAVAVPCASSRPLAVKRAKRWIDSRFEF